MEEGAPHRAVGEAPSDRTAVCRFQNNDKKMPGREYLPGFLYLVAPRGVEPLIHG